MSDKRNVRPDVSDQGSGNQGQDSTRERFSRQAMEQGTADSRDRVGRVADSRDRSAFRQQCGQELDTIRQDLKQASSDMALVNKCIQMGVKPGTPAYDEAFGKATQGYQKAVDHAKGDLYNVNRDGSVQMDPITGRPKSSDFLNRIKDERRMLGEEIDFLSQVKREGRQLTPTEMKKLNIDTPNVDEALMNRKQEDRAMKDLQRSVGYTEANFGLALIRASGGSADPVSQMAKGQLKLQEAASDDPWMLGHPPSTPPDANYMKHYREVMEIATTGGAGRTGDQSTLPGRGNRNDGTGGSGNGADQVPTVITDNGKRLLQYGDYRPPTGDMKPGDPNFVNPMATLNAAEQQLAQHGGQLTQTDVQNFGKAIAQADTVDRLYLVNQMKAEQQYMDAAIADPQIGPKLSQTLQQMRTVDATMTAQQDAMNKALPGLQQQGPDAVAMVNKLNTFNNVQELLNFTNDPANKAAIQKFQSVPNGAQFLSTVQQFMNNNAIEAQLDKQLGQIDPKFQLCHKAINEQERLYHSSEDTRAHLLRVLDPTPGQPIADANVKTMAGALVTELAKINPQLSQDALFRQKAMDAGVSLERTSSTGTTGGGQLDRTALSSVGSAYDAYSKVQPGQPLSAEQNAAFQKALQDAQRLTPEMINAQRSQLQQDLAGKGWSDAKETQFQALSKDVQVKFDAMSPDAQHQLDQLLNQKATTQDAQQQAGFQNQIVELGKKDPNVQAWMVAQDNVAKFQAQDPNLFNERVKFERAQQNILALQHAVPLIDGLYGTALLKTGDQAHAMPLLAQANRDAVVGQLVPEVGQAIKQSGADKLPVPSTGDATLPQAGTAGNAAAAGSINDQAFASLKTSFDALKQVPKDGQPLPAQLDAIFQNSIQLNSQVNPQQLEGIKNGLKQELYTPTNVPTPDGRTMTLPAWTDQKEKDYAALQMQYVDAKSKVSPQSQQVLGASTNQQDFDAKLQQLSGTDPTVKNYVAAQQQLNAYRQANPDTQKRDLYEQRVNQITEVQHGKGIAETLYAAALGSTGNQQDAAKAKTVMQDALKDGDLAKVFPQAADVARKLGLGDQSGAAANGPSPLDKIIPGYVDLKNALNIMNGKTGTNADRLAQADPLFNKAIEASNTIKIGELDKDLAANAAKKQQLEQNYATLVRTSGENPAALAQARQQVQAIDQANAPLVEMRSEPLNARMLYAIALNHTAADYYTQADKDKANHDQLMKQGDELNQKAAATLKTLDTVDPASASDPRVLGALKQIKDKQTIDIPGAQATGLVDLASRGLNPLAPVRAGAPLVLTLNLAGDVLRQTEPIPLIGPIMAGVGASAPSEGGKAIAADALAQARMADPAKADAAYQAHRNDAATSALHTVNDIAGGTAGVYIAGKVAPVIATNLAERLGVESANPWIKAGSFAVAGIAGFGTSAGVNRIMDAGEHAAWNTTMLNNAEWMSHSAASFTAAVAIKGIAGQEAKFTQAGVPVARPVVGEPVVVKPVVAEPVVGAAAPETAVAPAGTAQVANPGTATIAKPGAPAAPGAPSTPGGAGTAAEVAPVTTGQGANPAQIATPGGPAQIATPGAANIPTPNSSLLEAPSASGLNAKPITASPLGEGGTTAKPTGANGAGSDTGAKTAAGNPTGSATDGSATAAAAKPTGPAWADATAQAKVKPFGGLEPDPAVREAYAALAPKSATPLEPGVEAPRTKAQVAVDNRMEQAAAKRGGTLTPKEQMEAFNQGLGDARKEFAPGLIDPRRYVPSWRGFNSEGATGVGKYNPFESASSRYAEKLGTDPGSRFASYTYKAPQNLYEGMRGRYFNMNGENQIAMNGERLGTSVADLNARQLLGKSGWRFAEGAAGMGIYSLGTTNPWLTNADGKSYGWDDTFKAAGVQALWGGGASVLAAPLIPKVLHGVGYIPIKGAQALGWMAKSDAEAVTGKVFQGITMGDGIYATTAKAAATRFGVGYVGAGGLGTVLNSPLVDSKNTWGDALSAGNKWGLIGGGGFAVGPFAIEGSTKLAAAGANKFVVPVYEKAGTLVNTGVRAPLGRMKDAAIERVAGDGTAARGAYDTALNLANKARPFAPYATGFALAEGEGGNAGHEWFQWGQIHDLSDVDMAKYKKMQDAAAAQQQGQPGPQGQGDAAAGQPPAKQPPKPANETGPVANPYTGG